MQIADCDGEVFLHPALHGVHPSAELLHGSHLKCHPPVAVQYLGLQLGSDLVADSCSLQNDQDLPLFYEKATLCHEHV